MVIIGIDPALTCTGISNGVLTYVVKTKPIPLAQPRADLIRRVDVVMDSIEELVLSVPSESHFDIFVEGPVLTMSFAEGRGSGNLFEMGFWHSALWRRFGTFCAINEVPVTTLKRFILKGNMSKHDVALEVYKRWNVEFAHDGGRDMAHAYALYRIGEAVLNGKFDLTGPKQRKANKASAIANGTAGPF